MIFLDLVFAADTAPASSQEVALNFTSFISIIVALIALIGTFVSRKVKSPADELARADFAFKKITERLDEVNKDRNYLQNVIDTLRVQLTKFDADASVSLEDRRKLRQLVIDGEDRVAQLVEENVVLQKRLSAIADKVRLGLEITLADVYGEDMDDLHTPSFADIELTVPPKDNDAITNARKHIRGD